MKSYMLDFYTTKINFINQDFNLHHNNFTFVSWVKIKNTVYNIKNMHVVINLYHMDTMMPSFGLIKAIFLTK